MKEIKHDDMCPCTRFRAQPEFCQCGAVAREEIVADVSRSFGERLREINRATPPTLLSAAASDVLAERHRQVTAEGWSPAHDDTHTDHSLAKAAAIYTVGATLDGPDRAVMDEFGAAGTPGWMKELWPWDIAWWKPTDRRRDLVKAGALIIAEIERLDRATAAEGRS